MERPHNAPAPGRRRRRATSTVAETSSSRRVRFRVDVVRAGDYECADSACKPMGNSTRAADPRDPQSPTALAPRGNSNRPRPLLRNWACPAKPHMAARRIVIRSSELPAPRHFPVENDQVSPTCCYAEDYSSPTGGGHHRPTFRQPEICPRQKSAKSLHARNQWRPPRCQ